MHETKITSKSKLLGIAISEQPYIPNKPDVTGTKKTILEEIADSSKFGYPYWFYSGERIIGIKIPNYMLASLNEIDQAMRDLSRFGLVVLTKEKPRVKGCKPTGVKKEGLSLGLDKEIVDIIRQQPNRSAFVNRILRENLL